MKKYEVIKLIEGLEAIKSGCPVKVTYASIKKGSIKTRITLAKETGKENQTKSYTKQEICNYKSYICQKKEV